MLKTKERLLLHIFVFLFALVSFSSSALAAKLFLTLEASPTSPYHYSMKVDQVTKLAGLKVTITHDKKNITFVKAQKSKATNPFMHIANDKKDGQVIVVMASAKGISGKDVELMTLEYAPASKESEKSNPVLTIIQCQLMGEDLKEISCSFKD